MKFAVYNAWMFACCRVIYRDPESPRRNTVDGTIINLDTHATFLYAVVYEDGKFDSLQVYPCAQMDPDVSDLKSVIGDVVMRSGEEHIDIECLDQCDEVKAMAILKKDMKDASREAKAHAFSQLASCLAT